MTARSLALLGSLLTGCAQPERPHRPDDGTSGGAPAGTPTTTSTTCTAPPPPPHILVILADDLGWTGLSGGQTSLGHGSDFHETPRMDALADQAVAFSAAYTSASCQPARAALLTGQHAARTKVYTNFAGNETDPSLRLYDPAPTAEHLSLDAVTLAERLGPAGWRTALIGKWDIGNPGTDGPIEQGFDVNIGGTDAGTVSGGSDGHFARPDGSFVLPNLGPNGVPGQFMADRLTDEVIAWVESDLATPSFVFLAEFSVHIPIQAPDEDQQVFAGKPPGIRHTDPNYAAMVYNLDRNVGRLVDWLETTADPRSPCGDRLIDNTLLVLLSDNGGMGGYVPEGVVIEQDVTNQLPLRSGKGSVWEGGVRVPMIVRWDRGLAAGTVVDVPVQHVDVVPTVLDLADVPADGPVLDGLSLRPVLEGRDLGRNEVFFHLPNYMDYGAYGVTAFRETPISAAWDGRYKLTWRYETASWSLYDLSVDLTETVSVAADHPDVVQGLGTRLVDWLQATGADRPLEKGTQTPVPWPDPLAGI